MDTLTHALVGAVAARATTPGITGDDRLPVKTRVLVGGLAAAFPDIDFFGLWINPLAFIADWHRAETHSFVMLPVWALLLGLLFAWISRRKPMWKDLALVCGLSIFSHILTDLITSWGTQIFAPLSDYRASLGLTFIIDPVFTLIILTGLMVALVKHSRLIARSGLAVLAAYIGLQAVLKTQAVAIGEAYAAKRHWPDARVDTLPQPFSPFHWKIIVSEGRRYYTAYVDLIAGQDKPPPDRTSGSLLGIRHYYRPKTKLDWQKYHRADRKQLARQVWLRPEMAPYRRFTSMPVLYRIDRTTTNNCIWFADLRFILPTRRPPFRYGMCRQKGEADWRLHRLKRWRESDKERIG